jgi:hypothetical protein
MNTPHVNSNVPTRYRGGTPGGLPYEAFERQEGKKAPGARLNRYRPRRQSVPGWGQAGSPVRGADDAQSRAPSSSPHSVF